jgi:mono/diheme cytochrome c family protein
MKSCWLKLLVLLPLAWWLTSFGMSEFSPSQLLGLPRADADDQPAAGSGDPRRAPADGAGAVDYEKQIKPIFAKYCVECHKTDKNESGYRLDLGDLAIKGGDRGAAIIPGKSDGSVLYQALIGKGDVTAMPYEKPRLPAADIELIKKWIDGGAIVPANETTNEIVKSNHWSFQPIRRPAVPGVRGQGVGAGGTQNPIDAFVRSRLEREGLKHSSEADRPTLIRRLSLDLLGLLPSADEVRDFVNDKEPDAYERLVDRLLASPAYGERHGRHWLDIARYADSNGFTIDSARQIWKYREWVINAINADMPFDQFTVEQLAGDLLPNATTEQLVATGFHRNTLVNEEGGTDQEQFRVEAVVDRVSTTGAAWLGLTIGCAQCHSHKFDPISQRDFYKLFAVFNQCDEPSVPVPSAEQLAEQKRLDAKVADAEKPLKELDAELLKGLSDWERSVASQSEGSWTILDPAVWKTDKGATLTKIENQTLLVDFSTPANDVYTITFDPPDDTPITAIRLETLNHASLPMMGPGRADGNFVLSEFEVEIEDNASAEQSKIESQKSKILLSSAIADHSQEGYPVSDAIDGKLKTGWAINVKPNSGEMLNVPREAVFFPKEPIAAKPGSKLIVKMHQLHSVPNYLVGCFRISVSGVSTDLLSVPASIKKIVRTPADKRSKQQVEQLQTAFKNTDSRRKPLAAKLDVLKKQLDALNKAIPTTLVMKAKAEPRPTHIMIRGDFLRKGAAVEPGVPDVLRRVGSAEWDAESRESVTTSSLPAPHSPLQSRLEFAKWLCSPNNPLTARVTVNRAWQAFFGAGLVPTENDFGTQGDPPTHPELLDWLASEFVVPPLGGSSPNSAMAPPKGGTTSWSLKRLHRLIVTSATYRQASHIRRELHERDPANKLLARQSRLRLEAELIRDVCLSASGLLTRHLGGPGVNPPQPEGIYIVTQQKKPWAESTGLDRYRRGMYTYFWRTSPYPMLPTFDAPDANGTCTRRNRSNTPLQALTLANDRSFHEFAVGLSDRIQSFGPLSPTPPPSVIDSDDARLWQAVELCYSRPPTDLELQRLREFLNAQRTAFAADPKDKDPVKSAWIAVARVLLNLDEFITRE